MTETGHLTGNGGASSSDTSHGGTSHGSAPGGETSGAPGGETSGAPGGETSGAGASGGGVSRVGAARRWVARHKLVTGAAVVCLAAVATVSVISSGSSSPPHPAAPAFSLPALGATGQHVALGQYAGKPLIVNFWASWCEPCQKETPLLASFYRDQGGRVAVVGLDENDTSAAALKFAHAKGVTYPVGFDPGMTVSDAYGVYALPQTFVLNAQHRIVEHLYGALTTAELTQALKLMRS
jgi:cytochrome c biogenesis protein CcmG, thiol:disulfide interchange protein DsbE